MTWVKYWKLNFSAAVALWPRKHENCIMTKKEKDPGKATNKMLAAGECKRAQL